MPLSLTRPLLCPTPSPNYSTVTRQHSEHSIRLLPPPHSGLLRACLPSGPTRCQLSPLTGRVLRRREGSKTDKTHSSSSHDFGPSSCRLSCHRQLSMHSRSLFSLPEPPHKFSLHRCFATKGRERVITQLGRPAKEPPSAACFLSPLSLFPLLHLP